jgi:plastocyanin
MKLSRALPGRNRSFTRSLILIPLALAALVIGAPASAQQHATKAVAITHSAFVPSAVAIVAADSVTWTNSDSVNHQVVSQDAGFASPILKPGETYTHAFATAGKFSYKDALVKSTGNGTVTVTAPPPPPLNATLSLVGNTTSIVYGVDSATLTGKLSTAKSGQQILLSSQPLGEAQAKGLDTASTTANGEYSFTVAPTIQTVYTTTWHVGTDTATSPQLTVAVHPRVGLGIVRRVGNRFTYRAKVTSDTSYQGHYVYLQRYAAAVGDWVSLKRVTLDSTSRAIFSIRLVPHTTKLRLILPSSQAGNGYLSGVSRSVFALHR